MRIKLLLILTTTCVSLVAQVLCIKCYDQNAPVLSYSNNLIQNGGFESSTCIPDVNHQHSFCPNSTMYDCNLSGWTCSGGGSLTYASVIDSFICSTYNYSNLIEGSKAVYLGNWGCDACSPTAEDTSCLLKTVCQVSGIPQGYPNNPNTGYGGSMGVSVSQTVNGLSPGFYYALEFWVGGEYPGALYLDGLFALDVGFGNTFLTDPPTAFGTGIGRRYLVIFTAISSSHTIKFTNWGHITSNSTELILDDVRMFNVQSPSPCTYFISEAETRSNIVVFPNPASSQVEIEVHTSANAKANIFDLHGRLILSAEFRCKTTLDISGLDEGIYTLSVKTSEGIINKKLVLSR
jgi:hypothetical protein